MAEPASEDAKEPTSNDTGATPPDDVAENKRKFREALERKQTRTVGGAAHHGGGAQSRAHGPVGNRREFRRKSGG